SVLLSSHVPGALSSTCSNLLPSPKRIRSLELAMDLEGCSEDIFEPYVPREARLGVETGARGPVKVRVDRVTYPVIADDIPEPTQEGAVEVTYETLGGLVQRFHDYTIKILVHRLQAIE
nr:hypothetical protein [Tanacetum cinerariifolium]